MNHFSLEELGLVDADPEPAFTHLAELASRLIGVPVALVSFVQSDKDRQYFKARVGLELTETPLSHSFCRLVVENDAPLQVQNARQDQRVCDNPVIDALNVQSYLGIPVHDPEGNAIASLCVIDKQPRQWSEQEASSLEMLAQCVTDAIRLKVELREAEQLRRKQRDFAHAITHDIRGPLHTLGWVLDVVNDCHGEVLNEETRQLVEAGQKTALRTCQMADDLLDLMQVNAESRFDPVPVDLSVMLEDIMESIRADVSEQGALIEPDGDLPVIQGNRCQLDMLLRNLLSNAIKFHHPDDLPRIRVSARELPNAIELSVADNGIGVTQACKEEIFSPFERGDRSADYDGNGIGLSLVERVARNHGGHIRIESDGQHGSTFIVHLPQPGMADCLDDALTPLRQAS